MAGDPDPKHISTSYVERQNLTMRMHMHRLIRLTNGFSKHFESHMHMVGSIHRVLQLVEHSQDHAGYASDGRQG